MHEFISKATVLTGGWDTFILVLTRPSIWVPVSPLCRAILHFKRVTSSITLSTAENAFVSLISFFFDTFTYLERILNFTAFITEYHTLN